MMGNAAKIQPMTVIEAHKILGTNAEANYEQILKAYNRLYKANDNYLYLQSKVFRAKEAIDGELTQKGFDFSKYESAQQEVRKE